MIGKATKFLGGKYALVGATDAMKVCTKSEIEAIPGTLKLLPRPTPQEGSWHWYHTGKALPFTLWATGQPASRYQEYDCAVTVVPYPGTPAGKWEAVPCTDRNAVICQFP